MTEKEKETMESYRKLYETEVQMSREVCIKFGQWLLEKDIAYVDNTGKGNIYRYEWSTLTMEQLYEIYLKENL